MPAEIVISFGQPSLAAIYTVTEFCEGLTGLVIISKLRVTQKVWVGP